VMGKTWVDGMGAMGGGTCESESESVRPTG
jgi:hypothetical protein